MEPARRAFGTGFVGVGDVGDAPNCHLGCELEVRSRILVSVKMRRRACASSGGGVSLMLMTSSMARVVLKCERKARGRFALSAKCDSFRRRFSMM
jgi:hypothetical protein